MTLDPIDFHCMDKEMSKKQSHAGLEQHSNHFGAHFGVQRKSQCNIYFQNQHEIKMKQNAWHKIKSHGL